LFSRTRAVQTNELTVVFFRHVPGLGPFHFLHGDTRERACGQTTTVHGYTDGDKKKKKTRHGEALHTSLAAQRSWPVGMSPRGRRRAQPTVNDGRFGPRACSGYVSGRVGRLWSRGPTAMDGRTDGYVGSGPSELDVRTADRGGPGTELSIPARAETPRPGASAVAAGSARDLLGDAAAAAAGPC